MDPANGRFGLKLPPPSKHHSTPIFFQPSSSFFRSVNVLAQSAEHSTLPTTCKCWLGFIYSTSINVPGFHFWLGWMGKTILSSKKHLTSYKPRVRVVGLHCLQSIPPAKLVLCKWDLQSTPISKLSSTCIRNLHSIKVNKAMYFSRGVYKDYK